MFTQVTGEGDAIDSARAVIWVDVLVLQLAANALFDYLLLWATAAVTRTPANRRRLLAGTAVGTGYFLLYVLAEARLIPYYGLLRWVPVIVLVSAGMLLAAFGRLTPRRLVTVAAHFYGIGFGAAGAGMATAFLFGSPAAPDALAGFLAASGVILLIAELGWGVVQQRIWQQLYQMPLEVRFGEHVCRLPALVDTGNRLREPLSGMPVVVVEGEALHHILPEHLRPAVAAMETGDLEPVSRLLASERWSSRFRVIPFASIGREHGLLIGFRPDEVRVVVDGRAVPVGPCILGLCRGRLDPEGAYRALIHPELVHPGIVHPEFARPAQAVGGPASTLAAGRAPSADGTRRV